MRGKGDCKVHLTDELCLALIRVQAKMQGLVPPSRIITRPDVFRILLLAANAGQPWAKILAEEANEER